MAIKVDSTEILKEYFNRVLERADHHAGEVKEVALTLMGAVIWKSEDDIQVRSVGKDATGNVLWFNTTNSRYSFLYNHATQKIELHKDSMKGELIHEFNNESSSKEIFDIFSNL